MKGHVMRIAHPAPRAELVCSCGLSAYPHGESTARKFISAHFAMRHTVTVTGGEGCPVVRRFVIRRMPLGMNTRSPWILRDRSRPAYLGHFATHNLALLAVERKLREERGEGLFVGAASTFFPRDFA